MWIDLDGDAIGDLGVNQVAPFADTGLVAATRERGFEGATVRLEDGDDLEIATTTTDASGAYSFAAADIVDGTYDLVVEAMGGHGEHVTEPDEIAPAIERAFASGKPALVNVEMRKDVGAAKGSTYV